MWLGLGATPLLLLLLWRPGRGEKLAPFIASHNRSAILDEDGRVHLSWSLISDDTIQFEVVAASRGWIGFGLSPNGGMKGADMAIAGVDESGQGYVVDTHGVGNELPLRDERQNWRLVRAAENSTHTRLLLQRKLVTCDEEDFDISEDTLRAMWALGEEDLADPEAAIFSATTHKVGDRGSRSVIFVGNIYETPRLPENAYTMDFRHSNVAVPEDWHTHYWCQIFHLPRGRKAHMIRAEAIISPETRPYVHHILLYHCMGNMSSVANTSEQCFNRDQSRFSEMYSCATRMIAGWAVGGEAETLPDELGYPMFEAGTSPYYMLEVHYDNKRLHPGLVDHSGLRVWLVDDLRPIDVGSLSLGMGVAPKTMLIPPRQKRFVLYSFCSPMCTSHFPDEGINILSIFPHAHFIGVGVIVRHIRNGVELPPLMADHAYDFNYQDSRKFWPARKVLRNDTLLLECHYDSSKRTGPTFGGFATRDEMCFAFMAFYPRLNDSMTMCLAGPLEEEFARGMGARREPEQAATSGRDGALLYGKAGGNITLREYADAYDWSDPDDLPASLSRAKRRTSVKGELFQRRTRHGRYFQTCGRMAPDGATELDEHIAEFRKLLEHMQWDIDGNQRLPLPKVPRRPLDVCGRRQENSEDWEASDPIPKQVQEQIRKADAAPIKVAFSTGGSGSIPSSTLLLSSLVTLLLLTLR